jgi:hypothetical protein
MNFGMGILGLLGPLFFLAVLVVQIALVIWFIRTFNSVAESLRDIADRVASIEATMRSGPPGPRF